MIRLKDCPKCLGDLVFRQDQYGSCFSCVQCGLIKNSDKSASNNKVSIKDIDLKEVQVVTS